MRSFLSFGRLSAAQVAGILLSEQLLYQLEKRVHDPACLSVRDRRIRTMTAWFELYCIISILAAVVRLIRR